MQGRGCCLPQNQSCSEKAPPVIFHSCLDSGLSAIYHAGQETGSPPEWPLLPCLQGAQTLFTVEGPWEEALPRATWLLGGQGSPLEGPGLTANAVENKKGERPQVHSPLNVWGSEQSMCDIPNVLDGGIKSGH